MMIFFVILVFIFKVDDVIKNESSELMLNF